MKILIRRQNGEGTRLERDGKTRISAVIRDTMKDLGIKGRFTLRSSEGVIHPSSTVARAGGSDPAHVERVWKLEPVEKKVRKAAKQRKR